MQKLCAFRACTSESLFRESLESVVGFFVFPRQETQEERCQVWIKQRPHEQLNASTITKNTFVSIPSGMGTNILKLYLGSDWPAFGENAAKKKINPILFSVHRGL